MNSAITVYINSVVNEIFGKIEMKQIFANNEENPIELTIEIPIVKGMYLNQINCKYNSKQYFSKIYPKEKAEEKYTDAISEGNNAMYCKYDPENYSYFLNIGLLKPNSKIEFEFTFYYLVNSSNNNNYSFSLYKIYPNQYYDGRNSYSNYLQMNKRIKANISIKTISKIGNINSSFIDKNCEKLLFKFKSENEVDINYFKMNSQITSSSESDNKFIDKKQVKENDERILINFSTDENNKENILFHQFDKELNKTTYLLRILKNKKEEMKLENIFKKIIDNDKCLYFIIDKKEINYIYYCFVLPNNLSNKEIINEKLNYKEYQLEDGNEINKALMSAYLNEENIEKEINELKLAKEYQILSKNSCLFLNAENDNIIKNGNIKSYTYSRKNNENNENSNLFKRVWGMNFDDFLDFFGASFKTGNKNHNFEKKVKNIFINDKYQFLVKYFLKEESYDEKSNKYCEKCKLRFNSYKEHIFNECSFYSKIRKESIDKIKEFIKISGYDLNIDNKNLKQLIDDLFQEAYKLDQIKQNEIYEILDLIFSGFKSE